MISLIIQILACFLSVTATASSLDGFTMDLVQRRSNSSSSSSRFSTIQKETPYADTVFDTSEYLMKLQIGTPPVEFEGVLDTGSDIVWLQCLPCRNCSQKAPIFDPSKSSTYKDKRCNNNPDHSCPYEITYDDHSYSKGTLSSETVRIHSTSGQPFVMAETIIGCGHDNPRIDSSASGIFGLGSGVLSLISQMGDKFQGRLSYCFGGKGTSKISFGAHAVVEGEGTISTTMFKRSGRSQYYLNLDAISVGKSRVETLGTEFHALDGNIIIDSGTTYTYLPGSYCNQVKDVVDNVVTLERAFSPGEMLCYNSDTVEVLPVITMHFSGGADLVLDKYNMWDGDGEGRFCLAIICVDATKDVIFGNRAQNNLLVGYDPSAQLVSFKHSTDCNHVNVNQDVWNNSASKGGHSSAFWTWFLFFFYMCFL